MPKRIEERSGNGSRADRKIDYVKLLWIPSILMILGGGSFLGVSLQQDNGSIENSHQIEMLQQEVKLKLEPMEERLKRMEKNIEKIATKLNVNTE